MHPWGYNRWRISRVREIESHGESSGRANYAFLPNRGLLVATSLGHTIHGTFA